jgi:hypothetical protein
MKKVTEKLIAVVLFLFLIWGCGSDLDKPNNQEVKGGELVVDFSALEMKETLLSKRLIDENKTIFGYRAYKIPYTTTDEKGNSVDVSGLFVIPTGVPPAMKSLGFSMVSDDHGTIFANSEAPTVVATNTNLPDGSSVILTSMGGFATLQPDYIGFGDSYQKHYHPFILKKSSASTTIDFIKAVKVFAKENNIPLNNQLFLTGYSEGGYVSLATLEKLEQTHEMNVTMAIPMAGPYDVNRTAFGVLSVPKLSVPSFMADFGYAYAKAYDKELSSIINEPYASKLPTLLDGSISRELIDPELTYDTTGESGLFNPIFVHNFFTDSNYWFRKVVVENSVHAWVPKTSVRLLHCQGDNVIPYGISQITEATMNAMGANDVKLIPVEKSLKLDNNITHGECGSLAYGLATKIFSDVRKATIGY